MDEGAARSELWARYDSGAIGADELESRLRVLDHAPLGDVDAIRRAVEGAVRVRRRGSARPTLLVAVGAVASVLLLGGGLLAVTGSDDGGNGAAGEGFGANATIIVGGGEIIVGGDAMPVPLPAPVPAPPDCEEFDELVEENGDQFGDPNPPANPALLSDPAYLPAGYELNSEEDITPGTDPDIAMSTAAGNPPPMQILARSLGGDLPVRMRAFVFDSPETASANSRDLARSGLCNFDGERFDMPDHPELFGTVVTGVIPTTAFVSFTLGERRVIVAVEAGDGPVEAARTLAGEIAAAEYDAATTTPLG